MGVSVNHYFGVGAMLYKFFQYIGDIAAFGASGEEFAVAIGAGAAFAETPVGNFVNLVGAHHIAYGFFAFFDSQAALDNNRLQTQL